MTKIIITEEQIELLKNNIDNEITYYQYFNAIKSFLKELLTDPINAQVDELFINNGYDKKTLLKKLIDRNVIIRKEKIKELPYSPNGKKTSKMIISYDIPKKNFNRKLKRIFIELFNTKIVSEDGCAGMGGATSANVSADASYEVPFGQIQRRKINKIDDK